MAKDASVTVVSIETSVNLFLSADMNMAYLYFSVVRTPSYIFCISLFQIWIEDICCLNWIKYSKPRLHVFDDCTIPSNGNILHGSAYLVFLEMLGSSHNAMWIWIIIMNNASELKVATYISGKLQVIMQGRLRQEQEVFSVGIHHKMLRWSKNVCTFSLKCVFWLVLYIKHLHLLWKPSIVGLD